MMVMTCLLFIFLLNSAYFLFDMSVLLMVFWMFNTFSSLKMVHSLFLLDKLTFLLVQLMVWLFVVLFFISNKYMFIMSYTKMKKIFLSLILFLFLSFSLKSFLGFYIFFEISLIPLMFLIMGWGYQVERIQASFYLLVYTVVGSLPLLFVILFLEYNNSSSWFLFFFVGLGVSHSYTYYLFFWVCLGFFIKLPLYGLHMWLPKAHVEAPVSGSMILAAILLKLSFLGFYRVLSVWKGVSSCNTIMMSLLIVGALASSFIALRQNDLKAVIAYSSISHMGVMLAGLFLFSSVPMSGSFIIVVIHGFCSSALFYLVNFHYERSFSRQLLLLSAQMLFFLEVSFWWFLFLIINFAAPPFISLLGELLIMFAFSWMNLYLLLLSMLVSFFVAAFCIFIYSSLIHGKPASVSLFLSDFSSFHLVVFYHFFPALFIILMMDLFV